MNNLEESWGRRILKAFLDFLRALIWCRGLSGWNWWQDKVAWEDYNSAVNSGYFSSLVREKWDTSYSTSDGKKITYEKSSEITACVDCKIQVRNRQKSSSSNLIFQTRFFMRRFWIVMNWRFLLKSNINRKIFNSFSTYICISCKTLKGFAHF